MTVCFSLNGHIYFQLLNIAFSFHLRFFLSSIIPFFFSFLHSFFFCHLSLFLFYIDFTVFLCAFSSIFQVSLLHVTHSSSLSVAFPHFEFWFILYCFLIYLFFFVLLFLGFHDYPASFFFITISLRLQFSSFLSFCLPSFLPGLLFSFFPSFLPAFLNYLQQSQFFLSFCFISNQCPYIMMHRISVHIIYILSIFPGISSPVF